ncbi:hypothetical protein SLEP1_g34245 [Rubroshorea leprosula]|uniref:Uncharacterized protein n=1 Tax=Rubroshorea leprosula TaxID=152421 RepID=A0AAV5KJH0_9ROSI|nr:hypothetical protein SLEP1_g34245 [Rubroshorea leprosula]
MRKRRLKQRQLKLKRRNAKDMKSKLQRLREEMQEIGAEQRSIREGQRHVREKFEAIEAECQKLKRETRLVIQQSARNKIRLAIMFRIFKAREEGDFTKAIELTRLLREMVVRDNLLMRTPASAE